MGYYTYHEIELKSKCVAKVTKDDEEKIHKRFEEITEYSFARVDGEGSVKWYSRESDMVRLSKEFPHIRFDISGDGEEPEDIWEETWINGKCHHRDVVFTIESFDAKKLVVV